MTLDNLSPEAAALLRTLVNNPHQVEDGPALQELFKDRLAMGSPEKVHATSAGTKLVRAAERLDE